MENNNFLKIENDKEVKSFLKTLNDLNQDMKNIYCDETNFSPSYILTNTEIIYGNPNTIPQCLKYYFDKKLTDFDFKVIVDAKYLFGMLKNFKSEISIIEIEKDCISFKDKVGKNLFKTFLFNNKKDISFEIENTIEKFENVLAKDFLYSDYRMDLEEKYLKDIIDSKSIIKFILDVDDEIIYKDGERDLENVSYLPMYLHKKFLNGIYYKKKELKKGTFIESSPIYIDIVPTNREDSNLYGIRLTVITKIGKLEHYFILCDI